MKKVLTKNLAGIALEWVIAKSQGYNVGVVSVEEQKISNPDLAAISLHHWKPRLCVVEKDGYKNRNAIAVENSYSRQTMLLPISFSTEILLGVPLMDRYEIDTIKAGIHMWRARKAVEGDVHEAVGPTRLIAAMRVVALIEFGRTVEIPYELAYALEEVNVAPPPASPPLQASPKTEVEITGFDCVIPLTAAQWDALQALDFLDVVKPVLTEAGATQVEYNGHFGRNIAFGVAARGDAERVKTTLLALLGMPELEAEASGLDVPDGAAAGGVADPAGPVSPDAKRVVVSVKRGDVVSVESNMGAVNVVVHNWDEQERSHVPNALSQSIHGMLVEGCGNIPFQDSREYAERLVDESIAPDQVAPEAVASRAQVIAEEVLAMHAVDLDWPKLKHKSLDYIFDKHLLRYAQEATASQGASQVDVYAAADILFAKYRPVYDLTMKSPRRTVAPVPEILASPGNPLRFSFICPVTAHDGKPLFLWARPGPDGHEVCKVTHSGKDIPTGTGGYQGIDAVASRAQVHLPEDIASHPVLLAVRSRSELDVRARATNDSPAP